MSFFETFSHEEKASFLFGYISAYLMLILCFVVIFEISLSRKLKFQRFRLIAMLMGIQSLSALMYILNVQGVISDKYYRKEYKCPLRLGISMYVGVGEALVAGAIAVELCIALIGSYSLFLARKEVSGKTELALMSTVVLLVLSISAWIVDREVTASKEDCNGEEQSAIRILDNQGHSFYGIAMGLASMLLMTYIIMLGYRRVQEKGWKTAESELHDLDDEGAVGVQEKLKIISEHRKVVQEVIGFYGAYMLLSLLGIAGVIVLFISFYGNSTSAYSNILFYSGRGLGNLQAACQAGTYFYTESKSDGLSCAKMAKGLRRGKKITFANLLEEHLIEEEAE
eukprot:m.343157 g.343157  ORF g.343157 m.343157 type:complete len:340 (+) comp22426_c0_seq1:217-1236(+)